MNGFGNPLETSYRVVIDGARVVGSAFELGPSQPRFDYVTAVKLDELADAYIRPVIEPVVPGRWAGSHVVAWDVVSPGILTGLVVGLGAG